MLRLLSGGKQIDLSRLKAKYSDCCKSASPICYGSYGYSIHVVGIIAQKGGETSMQQFFARALEIPAVLSVKCNRTYKTGDLLIVDGEYGEVFLSILFQKTIQIFENKKDYVIRKKLKS